MSVLFPDVLALPAARIVTWFARNAMARGVSGREGLEDYVVQALDECGCDPELVAVRPLIDGLLATEPPVVDMERRQNGQAALATSPIPDDGDYATAEEIVREKKKDGWVVDVQKLCKVRNLPDNGRKGKGKRKFLRGPAVKWIETRCKRLPSSVQRNAAAETPLGRILGFLKTSAPASPFIIGFNTRLSESLVLRWLKEVPEGFIEDDDGKWSLIDP